MTFTLFKVIKALLEIQVLGDPTHTSHMIVGGEDAPILRHNYTVGIFTNEELQKCQNRPVCGGSLIAPNWVISAAHCEGKTPADRVVIGRHDFDNDLEEYEEINVKRTIVHESYYTTQFVRHDYDFMLIELEEESKYTPIKIDDGNLDMEYNSDVTALGWGFDGVSLEQPSTLQTVDMDFVPNFNCQLGYIYPNFQPISDRMMCAKRRGNSVCSGDSGGPLIKKGLGDDTDVLVGLTSFNMWCSTVFNSVFARVGAVTDWIIENVDGVRVHDGSQSVVTEKSNIFSHRYP